MKDLLEPAPCVSNDIFDPSLAYIPLIRRKPYKPKKKRGENEVKLFDFVDSSKAIAGSSDEEDERRGAKRKVRGANPEEDAAVEEHNEDEPVEVVKDEEILDAPKKKKKKRLRDSEYDDLERSIKKDKSPRLKKAKKLK